MIRGTQNPFSCSPAVISNATEILAFGTITRTDNTFTFSVGFKWKINGQVYENTVPFSITVPTATEGTSRIDLAILNTANGIERLQGNESPSIALSPIAPANTITLTSWNITGTIISDTSIDKSGRVFIYKTLVVYKIATNLLAGKLEVGDYCQGYVEGEFINANYLGGDPEVLASYNI